MSLEEEEEDNCSIHICIGGYKWKRSGHLWSRIIPLDVLDDVITGGRTISGAGYLQNLCALICDLINYR